MIQLMMSEHAWCKNKMLYLDLKLKRDQQCYKIKLELSRAKRGWALWSEVFFAGIRKQMTDQIWRKFPIIFSRSKTLRILVLKSLSRTRFGRNPTNFPRSYLTMLLLVLALPRDFSKVAQLWTTNNWLYLLIKIIFPKSGGIIALLNFAQCDAAITLILDIFCQSSTRWLPRKVLLLEMWLKIVTFEADWMNCAATSATLNNFSAPVKVQ